MSIPIRSEPDEKTKRDRKMIKDLEIELLLGHPVYIYRYFKSDSQVQDETKWQQLGCEELQENEIESNLIIGLLFEIATRWPDQARLG